jgi:hypothetical protein
MNSRLDTASDALPLSGSFITAIASPICEEAR